MKLSIYIITFIVLLSGIFAQSTTEYPSISANDKNTNIGNYDGDYDNIDTDIFTFASVGRGNLSEVSGMVAGVIDDNSYPGVINGHENGLYIYRYDATIEEMVIAYQDQDVRVHSPIYLFDGDSDGLNEIYFCGVDTSGDSAFMAYEIVNNTNLEQKWRTDIAEHQYNTSYSDFGCGFVQRIGLWPAIEGDMTFDSISAPVCGTYNSNKYCLFVAPSMTPHHSTQGRANNRPTIYRFDADDGDLEYFDPVNDTTSYAEVYQFNSDNFFYAYGLQDNYESVDQMYGDEKLFIPAVCDLDDDGDDEIMVPLGTYEANSDYASGILVVDIDTMNRDTSFSSDGFMEFRDSGASYLGSPLCQYNGAEYEGILPMEPGTTDVAIFRIFDSPNYLEFVRDGLGFVFSADAYEISQPFLGSYTGDGNQDVCVLVDDQGASTINIACAKYVGLTGDTLEEELFTYTGSYDLKPHLVATTGGGYDLGGDSFNDFMTPYGIFDFDPTTETPRLMTYGILGSTGICGMADIDLDGDSDVFCVDDYTDASNYTFYFTNTNNTMVDFNRFIPGIDEEIMCTGNQSFYVEIPTDGYSDVESDDIRVRLDCDNDGTFDVETNHTNYGTDFEVLCEFNESDTYTSKICMDDVNHQGVLTECAFYTTVVSDVEGCNVPCYPDCVYDENNAVIVNPPAPAEEVPQTASEESTDRAVDNFFDQLLGTNVKYRIVSAIAIILATMYGFMTKTKDGLISVASGMGTTIMLYLIGFLSGWILILILFSMIVVILFANTVFNKQVE